MGGNDNVDRLNDTQEDLIHSFTINLKFKNSSVNLVDDKYWLDFFSESLTKYSFSLDSNTFYVINDNECTISYTKSGSNL